MTSEEDNETRLTRELAQKAAEYGRNILCPRLAKEFNGSWLAAIVAMRIAERLILDHVCDSEQDVIEAAKSEVDRTVARVSLFERHELTTLSGVIVSNVSNGDLS